MSSDHRAPNRPLDGAKLAERLIAHARLCRHIAEECWSEQTAQALDALADECVRAAAQLASVPSARLQ